MASYRISIKPSAGKELESVSQQRDRVRLVERIRSLADAPQPHGCEKLSGRAELYRVRAGDYRVIYTINGADAAIEIVKVGHRKDAYR